MRFPRPTLPVFCLFAGSFLIWCSATARQLELPSIVSHPRPGAIAKGPEAPEIIELLQRMAKPDPVEAFEPLRRLKLLTSGEMKDAEGPFDPRDRTIDSADPSVPTPFQYPDGSRTIRIYLSGLRYLEGSSLDNLLRGGYRYLQKVRGFFPDGTEMTGASFLSHFPWDCEVHQFPDGSAIAHGGGMVMFKPGVLPNEEENYSRSRQWAEVELVPKKLGRYEERWHFRGFIHGDHPEPDQQWIAPGHFHNYGGTFFKDEAGNYLRDENGNTFMAYDRVTVDLNQRPWETAAFVRQMDATLRHAVGPEVALVNLRPHQKAQPYPATRRGLHGEDGFLLEGPRPFAFQWKGKRRWGVTLSAGDFTRDTYGINLAVSEEGGSPLGTFTPVLDGQGDLADFGKKLRARLGATWGPGRPAVFHDDHGKLWMLFHFIPKSSLPRGFVISGEPRNLDQAAYYARRIALAPVKIVEAHGRPAIELDEDQSSDSERTSK